MNREGIGPRWHANTWRTDLRLNTPAVERFRGKPGLGRACVECNRVGLCRLGTTWQGLTQEAAYACLILEDSKMTWSCAKQRPGSAEQRNAKTSRQVRSEYHDWWDLTSPFPPSIFLRAPHYGFQWVYLVYLVPVVLQITMKRNGQTTGTTSTTTGTGIHSGVGAHTRTLTHLWPMSIGSAYETDHSPHWHEASDQNELYCQW